MEYFKINDIDFSMYVNSFEVVKRFIYKPIENAKGDLIIQQKNVKFTLNVGIIPLDTVAMINLQTALNSMVVYISFLDPATNESKRIRCMIDNTSVSYYTIRAGNTKFKAFSLQFTEL